MIYLDNAATTKPKPEVISEIISSMSDNWCNPSSLYKPAFDSKTALESARIIIADSIKAKPEEIYFTSSGSEANNWALQGFCKKYPNAHIITSEIEHKSIIESSKHISGNIHYVPVKVDGCFDIEYLEKLLIKFNSESIPLLVSLQYANNETGVVQDIRRISNIVHKYNAYFHTDAVQAYAHHNPSVKFCKIDMMSVSGHKLGCPKGIGFLYIKNGIQIEPLIYGSQERNMRGGTENLPYIIGFAKAVELKNIYLTDAHRNYFEEKLEEIGCTINCKNSNCRLETIISCTLPDGLVGELFIYMLGFGGIYVSAGSACNSSSNKPSYVLKAIGLSDDEIRRTIRISFPDDIDKKTINIVVEHMKTIINRKKMNLPEVC